MSLAAVPARAAPWQRAAARGALLAAGLGAAQTARLAGAAGVGAGAAIAGCAFATAITGLAFAAGWRPHALATPQRLAAAGAGLCGAALLCVAPLAHRLADGPTVAVPPAPWLATWAAATVAVAVAEEVVLRGALTDAVARAWAGAGGRRGGDAAALGAAAVAFALLHVPLYGVAALPLDLAVGVVLGCLRSLTGTVTAPATAHAGADLAVWWVW